MRQADLFDHLKARGTRVSLVPRLPTPGEISRAEAELGVYLPGSYRAYLLSLSDLSAGSYWPNGIHHELTGGRLVDQTRDLWAAGLPACLLPFETSQDGDAFCFDLRSAGPEFEVVRWVHDDDSFGRYRWADFLSWVRDEWLPTIR